ncbi:MAG TPA: FlgD immunoglobulin-like domain containing protein [bacterium]|nr:FlgD immunoglobulin-like domain containing protein [bacterium]
MGGQPVTLVDTILNQYNSPLTQLVLQLPPNNPTSGIYWSFTTVNAPGNSAAILNPSGSTPGTITLHCNSNPITVNQTYSVTLIGTSSNQDGNWPISILSCTTGNGTSAPTDSSKSFVDILGVPDTPTNLVVAPVSFAAPGVGGAVSLSWSASVSETPLGYLLTRNPSGGDFSNSVTLPNGTVVPNAVTVTTASNTTYIDSSAVNQTAYTYAIETFNAVSSSATTTSGSVTPFVNPLPPTGLTAFTGGAAVSLNWVTPVATAGAYPVTGYQVLRDTQISMASATTIATLASSATHYTDGSPNLAATNYYELVSLDSQYPSTLVGADLSPASNQAQAFPPGYPPTGLTAQLTPGATPVIQVSWTAPAPASMLNGPVTGYQISLSPDGVFGSLVTVGSGTSYLDSSLGVGHYEVYVIRAFDGAGYLSNSATVTGYTGPPTLATPTMTPGPAAVTLSLIPLANTSSETITGYQLYRDLTPVGTPAPQATATVVIPDGTAVLGTNYLYQVAAVDSNGITGTLSGGVSGALLPSKPVSLTTSLNIANDNVTVGWATPVPAEPNLQKYYLIQSVNGASPTTLATPGAAVTTYLDTTPLSPGQYVWYELIAQNNLGELSPATTPVTQFVGPATPATLLASASATAVTLTWPMVANSTGETIASYRVYQNGVSIGTVGTGGTTLTYTDLSPVQGTNYNYQVSAVDTNSIEGNKTTAVTSALLPLVPQSFAETVQQTGVSFLVQLTWNAPGSSANVTNYDIYNNPASQTFNGSVSLAGVTFNYVQPYVDVQGLSAAGTTIAYFIRGVDPGGAGAIASTGLQIPPNPPTGVTATSSTTSIAVSWTGNPASENVSKYTLYRVDLASPGVTVVVGNTASGSVSNFTDNTAAQGVTYSYWVTATNPGGGVGFPGGESLASNSVITGLGPQPPAGFALAGIDASDNISVTWASVVSNATAVSLFVTTSPLSPYGGVTYNITPPTSTLSYLDNSAKTADTAYYYWLEAFNVFGGSTPAGPLTQLTYPATVSLSPVILAPDGISRILDWTTLPADVTSYNVYRMQLGTGVFSVTHNFPSSPAPPVTLTLPVTPGQAYVYKVTALNSTGQGPDSNSVTIGIPPSVPVSVTAVSGLSNSNAAVSLSWADPNASSEGVTEFTIYRNTSNTLPYPAPIATGLSAATTGYLDSTAVGGTTYYYLVEADSNDGTESKSNVVNAVAVTAFALPNIPGSVTTVDGNGTVNVSWGAPTMTTFPIAGYNVYDAAGAGTTVKANATPIPGTSANISLSNGVSYNLWVQAVDSQGNLSGLSSPAPSEPVAPPAVPGAVAGANGNEAVQITWNTSTPGSLPVSFYLIQKIALSGPTTTYIQVPSNMTGYVDNTGAGSNGATFVYQVEAVDSNSLGVTTGVHASGYSSPVTGVPGLFVNPPSGIAGTGGVSSASITWMDSFAGNGAPVTGYKVYRAQLPGAYSLDTTVATGLQVLNESSLSNGVTYSYYFVAYLGTNASANSATIFVVPSRPPNAPTGFTVTDGSNQDSLGWSSAGVTMDGVPVSQYIVTRNPGAPVTVFNATATMDTTVLNGNSYVYTVQAVNAYGVTSAASLPVTGFPYLMSSPANLVTSASGTGITVTWNAPASSFPVTGYAIWRGTASGGETFLANSSAASFLDASVTVNQIYYYKVAAIDNAGNPHTGPFSVEAGDAAVVQPTAPTNPAVSAGNGEILIDWSAPVSAAGSLPVSEYVVNSSMGGSVTLPATQTWFLETPLGPSQTVTYTVQAVDATGLVSGLHVGTPVTMTGTTDAANYNPPSALAATATGPTTVHLTWTPPNDLGYPVTGYYLYRSASLPVPTASALVTITNNYLSPVTVYDDMGVAQNTTYYYLLRAVYQGNNPSSNSNHATATTPVQPKPKVPVPTNQMGFDANLLLPLTGQKLGIYYISSTDGPVEIKIYNISGNLIQTLEPGSATANVMMSTSWDGKDKNGNVVAAGLYLIEIKAPGFHQVRKVAVVK